MDELQDRMRDLYILERRRTITPEQQEILEKMFKEWDELYDKKEKLERQPILEYLKKREHGKGRSKHYSSPLFRIYGGSRDSLSQKIKRVLNTYTNYNDEEQRIIINWLLPLFDGHFEEDENDFQNILLNYIMVNQRKISNILHQYRISGGSHI